MSDLKICTKCHKAKNYLNDFYKCLGKSRSECKKCTVKRNVKYQNKTKAWKYRYGDDDTRRLYMREYYNKNKEKFAQYRENFRNRYPKYYKDYFRKRKEKKVGSNYLPTKLTQNNKDNKFNNNNH